MPIITDFVIISDFAVVLIAFFILIFVLYLKKLNFILQICFYSNNLCTRMKIRQYNFTFLAKYQYL